MKADSLTDAGQANQSSAVPQGDAASASDGTDKQTFCFAVAVQHGRRLAGDTASRRLECLPPFSRAIVGIWSAIGSPVLKVFHVALFSQDGHRTGETNHFPQIAQNSRAAGEDFRQLDGVLPWMDRPRPPSNVRQPTNCRKSFFDLTKQPTHRFVTMDSFNCLTQ